MNTSQFIRRARKYSKLNKLEFNYDRRQGKGSHGRVFVGELLTTVKSSNKQIGKGLLHKMLRDLKIDAGDF